MDKQSFLKSVSAFKSATAESLEKLASVATVEEHASGRVIIPFGGRIEFLGLVVEGEAEVRRAPAEQDAPVVGRIGPGEMMGEISLLTGEPAVAEVRAAGRCRVLTLPQKDVSEFLARNPAALQELARVLTTRLKAGPGTDETAADARKSATDPYALKAPTAGVSKVLVFNCQPASLKYKYIEFGGDAEVGGYVGPIGAAEADHKIAVKGKCIEEKATAPTHEAAIDIAIQALTDPGTGPIKDWKDVTVIGHRVVHGGDRYASATVVDGEVIDAIRDLSPLAPMHNPVNLAGIEHCAKKAPSVAQVAVFDTAFHQKMPAHAYTYAIPVEFTEKDRIRRYGFHGPSHKYVAYQAAAALKAPFHNLKLITIHMGNGTSISAIDHGRSIDTSMGFTPMEGLVMSTRAGDLDTGAVFHLMRKKGISAADMEAILNRDSGFKGVSGISADMIEILKAADGGNQRALLAVRMYCYRVKKYIGAYFAALEGLDALVFTGGIGENAAEIRTRVCQGLGGLGIALDESRNIAPVFDSNGVALLSDEDAAVKVFAIRTDEERMIAREALRAVGRSEINQGLQGKKDRPIPIGVSAHHVHLSTAHVEALFGKGRKLTFKSPLSQPGQFACVEQLTLIGPKGTIERVRVLGPER
ncbi:MAG: acetate/propionate family kinase, partial [Deltaproteobacteria bacterium]|nr:acetate/propionate family kinase [Deltaproteobacteria bacterium]